MARLLKWNSPHIKLSTIEKMTGIRFVTLRAYRNPNLDYPISVRIDPSARKDLGLQDVFKQLGINEKSVVYINI